MEGVEGTASCGQGPAQAVEEEGVRRLVAIAAVAGALTGLLSDGGWAALRGGDGVVDAESYDRMKDVIFKTEEVNGVCDAVGEREGRFEELLQDS